MLPLSATEAELSTQLQLALERGELWLAYQPKIDLASGAMIGVEALARWEHPDHGSVEPSIFVPVAERSGLVDLLTDWLVRTALRQWGHWHDQGAETNVAINISALSLRDLYLPDYLQRACSAAGVPTSMVTLEVTEGATQHAVRLLDTLTRFRLKGMSLALDDFGTGYSSLLQLRQLPYTELKIDKCFVQDAVASRESRLIIKAIVDLAHGLGLVVTAEGIEDEETLHLLRDMGCDHGQGFLIARPMPGIELVSWMMNRCDLGVGERPAPQKLAASR